MKHEKLKMAVHKVKSAIDELHQHLGSMDDESQESPEEEASETPAMEAMEEHDEQNGPVAPHKSPMAGGMSGGLDSAMKKKMLMHKMKSKGY